MSSPPPSRAVPRLGHLVLLNALAAVWLAFSGIHRQHSSDSLLFSLASCHAWTPFFWHQDRVGLLVPLLASVCPEPVANVVLQTGLTIFACLCLPVFLAELLAPHPVGRASALLANVTMLAFAPDRIADNLLFECYYPQAMALGCAGLLVLGRGAGRPSVWRVLTSAGLLVLACWVYLGVPLWLGPLALMRAWLQPGNPMPQSTRGKLLRPLLDLRSAIGLVLILVSFAAGYQFMRLARQANPWQVVTPSTGLPPREWPESWSLFAEHLQSLPGMATWEAVLAGLAGLGLVCAFATRQLHAYPILAAAPIVLIPAVAEFLFIGTREWPALNDHHPRYLLGCVIAVQCVLTLIACMPLAKLIEGRKRAWVFAGLAVLLFLVATVRYGWPAPDRPRRELEARTDDWTEAVLDADTDAFGGGYWIVWRTVFHANMVHRQRGDHRFLYAVSDRGRVLLMRRDWVAHPTMTVAVLKDPDEFHDFLIGIELCGLAPPEKITEHGPFAIYSVRPLTPYP